MLNFNIISNFESNVVNFLFCVQSSLKAIVENTIMAEELCMMIVELSQTRCLLFLKSLCAYHSRSCLSLCKQLIKMMIMQHKSHIEQTFAVSHSTAI